jgi:hypothetical protein
MMEIPTMTAQLLDKRCILEHQSRALSTTTDCFP